MYPYSKSGIPISNNISDMFWTQLFYKLGQSSKWPKMVCDTPPSKLHPHTKFGIPTLNNIRDVLQTQIFLKTRSEVNVTVTHKWYKTLHHPKMHSHTKIGFCISNNIRDMLLIQLLLKLGQRSRSEWPKNGKWHPPIPRCIYTSNLEFLSQRIWDMLGTQ